MSLLQKFLIASFVIVALSILFITVTINGEARFFNTDISRVLKSPREEILFVPNTPSPALLSKLNAHERQLELATDPLPQSAKCIDPIFLAIFVASSPTGFIRRNTIRGTWASTHAIDKLKLNGKNNWKGESASSIMKVVFLIGKTDDEEVSKLLKKEAEVFGDIVFGQLQENYRNLTMKTRLGLKWAGFYCRAKYILKTDDDVFINAVPLINWLQAQPRTKFYSGWCNFNSPVVRDPNNKWFISQEDFSGSNYPGYCLGGGYVMSADVVERILAISYGRKLFPMEDLYVGLMIKDLKDVPPKDNRQNFNLVFGGTNGCNYNNLFLAHPVDHSNQMKMFLQSKLAQDSC